MKVGECSCLSATLLGLADSGKKAGNRTKICVCASVSAPHVTVFNPEKTALVLQTWSSEFLGIAASSRPHTKTCCLCRSFCYVQRLAPLKPSFIKSNRKTGKAGSIHSASGSKQTCAPRLLKNNRAVPLGWFSVPLSDDYMLFRNPHLQNGVICSWIYLKDTGLCKRKTESW